MYKKRIALPCPFCGAGGDNINLDYNSDISQFWIHCWKCHADGPIANYNANDALAPWNACSAPPVGRCRDCTFYTALGHCQVHSRVADEFGPGAAVEMLPDDFCSYFTLKEA